MSDLKEQLVKLGTTNPELRPHIRKILASGWSFPVFRRNAESDYKSFQKTLSFFADLAKVERGWLRDAAKSSGGRKADLVGKIVLEGGEPFSLNHAQKTLNTVDMLDILERRVLLALVIQKAARSGLGEVWLDRANEDTGVPNATLHLTWLREPHNKVQVYLTSTGLELRGRNVAKFKYVPLRVTNGEVTDADFEKVANSLAAQAAKFFLKE